MKLTLIIFEFVTVVSALQQDKVKLPQEKLAIVHNIGNSCAAEHNIDGPSLTWRIADGTLPRDETTSKFMHCFAIKAGLVNNEGYINVDKVAGLVGNHPKVKEFKQALTKCNEVTKKDPVENTVHKNTCYAETSPILLIF